MDISFTLAIPHHVSNFQVRYQLEKKMKQRFEVYDTLLYQSQVVAGRNYLMKVFREVSKMMYIAN